MDANTSVKLFCSLLLLSTAVNSNNSCAAAKCSTLAAALEIQSLFQIKDGFTLLCKGNKTTIRLPQSRDLHIYSISYNTRKLSLVDPKNCIHEVFLDLNLSLTPFRYYYDAHDYKYINCSTKVAGIEQVPCLSGAFHHVYVVEPSFSLPVCCSAVKTVAIPFSYNPYLSGSLDLTWQSAPLEHKHYTVFYAVLSIIGLVFVAGKVWCASFSRYGSGFNAEENDGLLGKC